MDVTIDLRTLGIIVVGIALLILIIYLVILIRNANITVKKSHKLLDDLEEITDIASTRTVQLNDAADNLLDSIQDVSEALKGNQDLKKSVGILVNAFASLKNIVMRFKKNEEDNDDKKEKNRNLKKKKQKKKIKSR